MLTVTFVLALIALILALVSEAQANGRDLDGWAIVALSLIFLADRLG